VERGGGLQVDVGQLLWVDQALGVSLLAEASLFQASDIGSQLVFGPGRLGIDLVHVWGEELLDLGFEGVEGLDWLLEDVADHQLGAVVGVKLKSRAKHGVELLRFSLTLSALLAIFTDMLRLSDVLSVDFCSNQLLLGNGNTCNDNNCKGDRVNCSINSVDQSKGHEAGDSSKNLDLHLDEGREAELKF